MSDIAKLFATAVTATALALAGCGGDDDEDGADTAPAGTATESETVTETETQTVTEPTGTTPEARPTPVDCGDVAFEPNTDAGAFGIRATGVACEQARDVAAAAEQAGGLSYDAGGFTCSGAPRGGALPTIEWTCADAGAEITFSTS